MATTHTIRTKTGTVEATLTPRTAIKAHCAECMCWNLAEVVRCTAPLCPLYPFRLGDAHSLSEKTKRTLSKNAKNRDFSKKTTSAMG